MRGEVKGNRTFVPDYVASTMFTELDDQTCAIDRVACGDALYIAHIPLDVDLSNLSGFPMLPPISNVLSPLIHWVAEGLPGSVGLLFCLLTNPARPIAQLAQLMGRVAQRPSGLPR